jgi:hypothetical protein
MYSYYYSYMNAYMKNMFMLKVVAKI